MFDLPVEFYDASSRYYVAIYLVNEA